MIRIQCMHDDIYHVFVYVCGCVNVHAHVCWGLGVKMGGRGVEIEDVPIYIHDLLSSACPLSVPTLLYAWYFLLSSPLYRSLWMPMDQLGCGGKCY